MISPSILKFKGEELQLLTNAKDQVIMGLFSTVVVCLLASLTLADLPVVSPLPRTTTASYVTASVLPALVLGNGWVVSATYNATYCINTSSTKVNSGSGVPPDYVGALPALPTSIFPISDTVFGLISGKWFWAFNYTCQLQYAWVTPDDSTLDVAQSGYYGTGYAVPLTLNGKVYVGSMNLSTSGTSSLFVLSATGYVWSAPLPFYKSTWAPSTNPWGTAVYVRSSSYNSNTGSYVCIVNLANKTVTNAATLFQYDNVGYFPLFVSANTWLAVTIDDTLYFFNGMTGALISTKPLPTSCSYPLTIQFSNATMCLYYACSSQLTVYNWSTSAATAYQLYGSNTITSMAIAPCGCVFVSSSYYLGWYSMYGVWNSSVVNVDYTINNLGWANTTLMLQMANYIYGINPWTAWFKWSITRDRSTNAPAVTTNMGWTIFFTDAGSSYMQNSQLQGYDTILPNNSFATTFPVTTNSFDKSNYYYNATGWTSYYTATNKWYAVNTFNGASKVADMSLESIYNEAGLVPYGPWVCTAPHYRALCWNAQSATTISSATFLTYSSQAVQISGKYLFVQSYYESYYVDLSLPTLTGVSLAIGTSNSVVGAAFIGSTKTVLTVTNTKLFSKTILTSSGDESPIRSSALFEYYRSAPAMYNSDFYVAAALNNADYGVRRVGGLTGLAYGGFVITKGQSSGGFVWLIPGQGGKYGGGVFYVFNSTSVTAMDASNGALFFTTWMPHLDTIRSTQAFKPVVTLEGALLISTSSYLVVLSAITGKLLWYQTSAFEFPPQYTYGSIYWSSKSYTIAVSNPGNGQIYAEFQYQSSYTVQSVVVTQQPDNSTRLVAVSRYSDTAAVFTGEVVAAFATAAPAGNPFAGGFAPSNNGPSLLDLLKENKAYIAGIVIGALVVIVVVVLVVRNRSQKPRDEDYVPMNPSTPSHTQV